jgi:hypothetical protein
MTSANGNVTKCIRGHSQDEGGIAAARQGLNDFGFAFVALEEVWVTPLLRFQ